MRPRSLDEFVGQRCFIGEGKLLRRTLEADRVTSALQGALDAAGIETPYPTRNLNLHVEPETVDRFSMALGERNLGRER